MNTKKKVVAIAAVILAGTSIGGGIASAHVLDRSAVQPAESADAPDTPGAVDVPEPGDTPDLPGAVDVPEPGDTPDLPGQ